MNARFLITSFALSVTLLCHAEDPPKADQVARLVRAFVFARKPDFNTNTEFKVRKLDIKGLWEEMKTEVVYVDCKIKGSNPPDDQFMEFGFAIYYGGKIVEFEEWPAIMSGLVSNGDFYYTWVFGSGLVRSQVVRLRIADGKVEISKSAEFPDQDQYGLLFVSAGPGGKVRVSSGMYTGEFNQCEEPKKDIGFVGETNSSGQLQIVDANGKVVTPAD
ncbi:MAG TPA: hypothetical protein VNV43_12685 [Candidatus Acidoferrales bacterium]|jgi:hypothetical protein|nr:hypothetical protein [Candidatus Acidoferrales bacterium]